MSYTICCTFLFLHFSLKSFTSGFSLKRSFWVLTSFVLNFFREKIFIGIKNFLWDAYNLVCDINLNKDGITLMSSIPTKRTIQKGTKRSRKVNHFVQPKFFPLLHLLLLIITLILKQTRGNLKHKLFTLSSKTKKRDWEVQTLLWLFAHTQVDKYWNGL